MCLSNLEILAIYQCLLRHYILSFCKLVTRIRLSFVSSTCVILETSSFAVLANKGTHIIALLNKTNSVTHIMSCDVMYCVNK